MARAGYLGPYCDTVGLTQPLILIWEDKWADLEKNRKEKKHNSSNSSSKNLSIYIDPITHIYVSTVQIP